MAISDTINSLKEHIGNAYTAIGNKKGTVPTNKNCENLQAAIESISTEKEEQAKTVTITENGTQKAIPDENKVFTEVTIVTNVPATPTQEVTKDLDMTAGDQIIIPASGYNLSKATVKKPATFVAGNIKKGVDIGGVTGTLEPQKEEEAGTATITENGSQTFSPTSGKAFSNFTVITNVPTGVNTDDATAVASDILSGKTAYAKGVKLTGSVETYNGAFVVKASWKASVSNLGAQDPNAVVFNTPADSVPKPWSEVEFNGDVFIKFPKMYKKIVTVTDNQITAFEIANAKLDDDYKLYPCFIDESGNELDYILVGKYMSKSSTTCNSVASGSKVNQTLSTGRTRARGRGNGYQLMDWRIQRLWQDLVICAYKKIDINSGSGISIDALGLDWENTGNLIDGFCYNGSSWVYSNSPSKYIDSPTVSSNGYASILGYTTPINNGEIKKLGYDPVQPFFNYPSEIMDNPSYNTYYCDAYSHTSGNHPIYVNVGGLYSSNGAFRCFCYDPWSDQSGVRLCYRPISS